MALVAVDNDGCIITVKITSFLVDEISKRKFAYSDVHLSLQGHYTSDGLETYLGKNDSINFLVEIGGFSLLKTDDY